MEFLGRLGIDPKLLIAQIINFGILLWLLKTFLYRPIIKSIEEDEAEIKKANRMKDELNKEKDEFDDMKEKEIHRIRQQSRDIIEEAESIAEEIKVKAQAEVKREAELIIKQKKSQLKAEETAFENKLLEELRASIADKLTDEFKRILSGPLKQEWQNAFFGNLLDELKTIEPESLSSSDSAGRMVLEFESPPDSHQKRKLNKLLEDKLQRPSKLTEKHSQELIAGFRLELGGIVIESNLLNIIKHAATRQH